MVSIVNVYDIWRGRYTQKETRRYRGRGRDWDGMTSFDIWVNARRNGMGTGKSHVSINDHELESCTASTSTIG